MGTTSVSSDDLVLTVSGVPANQFGVLFMGGATNLVPFGDGIRCVGPGPFNVCRFLVQNGGPSGTLVQGPGIVGFSNTLEVTCHVDAGETWFFQGWYRDPGGPCNWSFNTSNGLEVTFTP